MVNTSVINVLDRRLTWHRYHGKCLKIARGKVKDDEKYTCPICDWRVRIPRDAARPKLEDLQAWQDEIPTLPFQPDEEAILEKIINNAQEFRQAVSPYCNPIMSTADEAETQRFYLRKIEGAEILLAYETNFFRQELHKWSPVAPEPPPILDASKSTRKPRPTKLQKLMAQHGVDDPEQLPQSLKTKPHNFKRKSSEPSTGRPHPLQPAPGRSDSGTPTSHSFPPGTMHPHGGPTLSGLPSGNDHAHPSHFGGFAGVQDPHFSMSSPSSTSPAFAPHAFLHGGGLQSPGFGGPGTSPRGQGIFNDAAYGRIDGALGSLGGGPGHDLEMRDAFGGSSQGVAQMFNELTNQDGDDDAPGKPGDGAEGSKAKDRESEKPGDGDREGERDTKWEENEDMQLFFDGP
jgi:histone demethylase JARID1